MARVRTSATAAIAQADCIVSALLETRVGARLVHLTFGAGAAKVAIPKAPNQGVVVGLVCAPRGDALLCTQLLLTSLESGT
jgi:hypothetical protein